MKKYSNKENTTNHKKETLNALKYFTSFRIKYSGKC